MQGSGTALSSSSEARRLNLFWDWKSLSESKRWGCLPPARRSLPVLSSYAIPGHFHNDFALKAARAKQGAQGSPGNGAGRWGPRGRCPGDTAESAVGL